MMLRRLVVLTALMTSSLAPGAAAHEGATSQTIALEGCKFTLYYFKDSAQRLQAYLPPGYVARPHPTLPVLTNQPSANGTATIAAAAYGCDRVEVPGAAPAPAVLTLLSILVYPPSQRPEGPANSDFYVLWMHADNERLVDLLAARGMPAHFVPGMSFLKPAQSLAVRTEVPWSQGAFELLANGFHEDVVHPHNNSFLHVAADGRPVRMDFLTPHADDQFCFEPLDHHATQCGRLTAHPGSPIVGFFGGLTRTATNAWDHLPIDSASFVLIDP